MCYLASSMLTHQALGFSIRTPLLPLLLFFPSSPFSSLFSFTFLFYKAINERYHVHPLTNAISVPGLGTKHALAKLQPSAQPVEEHMPEEIAKLPQKP